MMDHATRLGHPNRGAVGRGSSALAFAYGPMTHAHTLETKPTRWAGGAARYTCFRGMATEAFQ